MSPLRWTTKSTRNLAGELTRQGHKVSADVVAGILHEEGFSLQGNAKTVEGARHPDRDGQFRHLNEQVKQHQQAGNPVVSVDTKKSCDTRSHAASELADGSWEDRRYVGCVVPGQCSRPVPTLTCVAGNCGVKSSTEKPKRARSIRGRR
jgi:hypothetical protein